MSRNPDFAKIIRDVFALDPKWVDWFVDEVYTDEQLRFAEIDGKMASVLLATPYTMEFHGKEVRCEYLSCVATVPNQRGKGLMHHLMHDTLAGLAERGVPFAALIPASRPLYFIYDRMGFATVFYVDEERYTALHKFEKGDYKRVEPDYEMFYLLESQRRGSVRHDETQFSQILEDLRLSNGIVAAVDNGNGSYAVAFAEVKDEIKILDILSTDQAAADAALSEIRDEGGEKGFVVSAVPTDDCVALRSHGMLRICNVEAALNALAETNPKISMTIRIKDRFLPENNGVYVVKAGRCERKSDGERQKLDLDVSVSVLAEILFSTTKIGDLFNLPTRRPFISLMLD